MADDNAPLTEVHQFVDPTTTYSRAARYLAEKGEVGRVLLLYSGGLDTSVMLKWIQDEYEAEVVALTVNLGQPGEDYEVVKGKAMQLGARLAEGLAELPGVRAVRARGLMAAIDVDDAPGLVRRALLKQRLVLNATGPQTARFLPPLVVAASEIDEALRRVRALLDP